MDISDIYIEEYHAGGLGSSMQRLSNYAPHFYRFCDKNGSGYVMIKETLLKKLIGETGFEELRKKLER